MNIYNEQLFTAKHFQIQIMDIIFKNFSKYKITIVECDKTTWHKNMYKILSPDLKKYKKYYDYLKILNVIEW